MSASQSEAVSHIKGLFSIEEVEQVGKTEKGKEKEARREVPLRKGSDLVTVSFTSGSTGVCTASPLLLLLFSLLLYSPLTRRPRERS